MRDINKIIFSICCVNINVARYLIDNTKNSKMKYISTVLFIFYFSLTGNTQSLLQKRLELKRLYLENKYKNVGYFDTLTGIATVYDNGYMGYIDSNSKLILPISYVSNDFSDGSGVYHDIQQNSFKIIDKKGTFIKEFKKINSLRGFKNGLSIFSASTEEGIRYGVMDFNGNIIIKNKYPYIEKISEKYYYVNSNKDGAGIINSVGDTVIPIKYEILYIDTSDLHFIGYTKEIGYGIFDSSENIRKFWGKEVNPESSHIEGVPYFQRDSVIVIKNQWSSTGAKTALVNLNLDTIISMGKYNLSSINEGMICFYDTVKVEKLDKKVTVSQITRCGFLNTKGEIVIPAKFDFAQYFTEGLCAIRQNNKWGYIDKQGKIVIPIKYDYALPFRRGFAKVQIKESFFIIDRDGEIVLNSKSY